MYAYGNITDRDDVRKADIIQWRVSKLRGYRCMMDEDEERHPEALEPTRKEEQRYRDWRSA